MLFWTFQITIISIILIFLVHHLIIFFKSTLTVPKIKDLVNAPVQKYENIYNTISNSSSSSSSSNLSSSNSSINSSYIDELLPKDTTQIKPDDVKSMKDELKSFLKNKIKSGGGTSSSQNDKLNVNGFGSTNISTLDSFSSPNYSTY
jgi:cell shape-determining protein MreC